MVITDNQVLQNVYEEQITIANGCVCTLKGIVNGKILATDNSEFVLTGTVNGELHIEKNSSAQLDGVLNGDIFCDGTARISGVVVGNINNISNVTFEKGAIYNGVTY